MSTRRRAPGARRMGVSPTTASRRRDFDPDALREKYRRERNTRLRADGNDQYFEVKEKFAHFLDDPYAKPGFTRAPLSDETLVAVPAEGRGGGTPPARGGGWAGGTLPGMVVAADAARG